MLKIQNVGFLQRKAIGAAHLELTITVSGGEGAADGGATRFDTVIRPSLGPTSTEERVLDWGRASEVRHPLFGNGTARARWATVGELGDDEFLAAGWEDAEGEVILMENTMDSGVVTRLVHGFEVVGGERHYVRHVVSKNKKGEVAKVRLVYNYEGAA